MFFDGAVRVVELKLRLVAVETRPPNGSEGIAGPGGNDVRLDALLFDFVGCGRFRNEIGASHFPDCMCIGVEIFQDDHYMLPE